MQTTAGVTNIQTDHGEKNEICLFYSEDTRYYFDLSIHPFSIGPAQVERKKKVECVALSLQLLAVAVFFKLHHTFGDSAFHDPISAPE